MHFIVVLTEHNNHDLISTHFSFSAHINLVILLMQKTGILIIFQCSFQIINNTESKQGQAKVFCSSYQPKKGHQLLVKGSQLTNDSTTIKLPYLE